jgi:hypothetical protein
MDDVKFYASWAIDIVGFTKNSIESQKNVLSIINNAVKEAETTLQGKMRILYRSDTGDGWMIAVPHDEAHYLIQFTNSIVTYIQEKNKNRREKIQFRIAIHVDLGYKVDDQDQKISGEVFNKLKRILDLGYADDILLSETAVSTIEAKKQDYSDLFSYAGRYPIKHGYMIETWFYKYNNIGNAKRPKRKRTSLFIYITKKNKSIASFLIVLSIISSVLTGLNINSSSEMYDYSDINIKLQKKILEINEHHMKFNQDIGTIFQKVYDNSSIETPVNFSLLWDNNKEVQKKINGILENVSDISKNNAKDIKYAWLAEPISCYIKAYTFGDEFNNVSGVEKDWCKYGKRGSYLADTLFATGQRDYSNVLVSPIKIRDSTNKPVTLALFGESINWYKVLPSLITNKQKLYLLDKSENMAVFCQNGYCKTLVNTGDILPYHCIGGKCYDDETNTIVQPNLIPKRYGGNAIDNYLISDVFKKDLTDNSDTPSIYNQFFTGWKVYIFTDMDKIIYQIHIAMFAISLLLLIIILYYYLIPRHWLEDINEVKRIDNRK